MRNTSGPVQDVCLSWWPLLFLQSRREKVSETRNEKAASDSREKKR